MLDVGPEGALLMEDMSTFCMCIISLYSVYT